MQLFRIERGPQIGDLRDDVGGQGLLTFADQRARPAADIAGVEPGLFHGVEIS
jgi:hypothetical protein